MSTLRRFSSQFLGMNSTLIYEGGYGYLVDPGVFPHEVEKIRQSVLQKNISELTILLTHTHGDHISGWARFRDFPTYVHEAVKNKSEAVKANDVKYLRGILRKQNAGPDVPAEFPENPEYLRDGEKMEIPPFSFSFYHVPGHSADMSLVHIPELKLLFSGDMLIDSPVPFILHNSLEYWDSLKKCKLICLENDVQQLIPGHGKPARTFDEVLGRIEKEQLYLQKLVWEAIKLFRTGIPEADLHAHLLQLAPGPAARFSHQTNVNTLLRDLNEWVNRESELTITF
ncbi:MAG: MBL fold metallo-hydrolase [Calditrichia bacterium]